MSTSKYPPTDLPVRSPPFVPNACVGFLALASTTVGDTAGKMVPLLIARAASTQFVGFVWTCTSRMSACGARRRCDMINDRNTLRRALVKDRCAAREQEMHAVVLNLVYCIPLKHNARTRPGVVRN